MAVVRQGCPTGSFDRRSDVAGDNAERIAWAKALIHCLCNNIWPYMPGAHFPPGRFNIMSGICRTVLQCAADHAASSGSRPASVEAIEPRASIAMRRQTEAGELPLRNPQTSLWSLRGFYTVISCPELTRRAPESRKAVRGTNRFEGRSAATPVHSLSKRTRGLAGSNPCVVDNDAATQLERLPVAMEHVGTHLLSLPTVVGRSHRDTTSRDAPAAR